MVSLGNRVSGLQIRNSPFAIRNSQLPLPAAAGQYAVDGVDAALQDAAHAADLGLGGGEPNAVTLKLEAEYGVAVLRHQAQHAGAVGAHPLGRWLGVQARPKVRPPVRRRPFSNGLLIGQVDAVRRRGLTGPPAHRLAVLGSSGDRASLRSDSVTSILSAATFSRSRNGW